MSLDWQTFKSTLGQNTSVTYIDEEDSEIPIDSDYEFQEALRLARLNKKHLRIIVCDNKSQPSQKRYLTVDLPATPVANPTEKVVFTKTSTMSSGPSVKETCCQCKEDEPPEWFTHYMKKFKKQLLHELKSYILYVSINKAINSTVGKEKKLTSKESAVTENFPVTQIKKKKLEKDSDVTEQREVKQQKKLVRLRCGKSERLEKLDLEEERGLKEAKTNCKPNLAKTRIGASEKKTPKSIVFYKNNFSVNPRSEFVFSMHLMNNGSVRWSKPRLEFFDMTGLFPEDVPITLPSLRPKESCFVTLGGKVSQKAGVHYFTCRAFDGAESFGPKFTCWVRVEPLDSTGKAFGVSAGSNESDGASNEGRNPVASLIDYEVIASSQKKIEENIVKIQKRLRDIDLLRASTSSDTSARNSEKWVNGNGEKSKTGFDVEVKEKSWTERLEEEKVLFGVDCLSLNSPVKETCNLKTEEKADVSEEKNSSSFENIKNDADSDPDTDGDMSVIFVSEEEDEEEENFIVVPSKSPSPAGSMKEDMISLGEEIKASNEVPEVTKEKNLEEKKESQQQKEEVTETNLLNSARSRRSPCGEEIFKPKKIKSKSTEYHFTTENLSHSTFSPVPEGISEKRPSTFKFTAGKEENSKKDKPQERKGRKENIQVPKIVPKTDALGRVIYAVNGNGCCMPIEVVLKQENKPRDVGGTSAVKPPPWPRDQEKRSGRCNEIPAVSILPNALMNGASNVASMAFNTARSVINNLQSAFVSEGKTEVGHPAADTKESVSTEALNWLSEMGFLNYHLNRELLHRHSNDLAATIEELIRLQEQSKGEGPK